MLNIFVTLFFTLISLNGFAASVQGEGRFYANDDDSLSFIKSQVIHNGFIDVISKEILAMGLNKDVFWKKYDDKFEDSFISIDNSLKEKYQVTEESKELDKRNYIKALRVKKLNARKAFGKLPRVVQSYGIKRYTRSQQDPNARYVKLEATINRNLLRKIYYNYVQGKKLSAYGSLFLDINYKLVNCDYTDLGVEKETDFTDVVNKSWLKWFSENKPGNIANIEILESDKKSRLDDFFKLPYEKMISDIPEVFVNSLYLKIEIKIEKTSNKKSTKEYQFSFSGGGYLLDLQSNNVLSSLILSEEKKKYRNLDYSKLSTVLANHIYRMPLIDFQNLKKTIKNIPPINSIHRLSLFDFSNMQDVDSFLSILKGRGIKYSLNARLESLGTNRAEVVIFMDGEIADLKSLLSTLAAAKNDLQLEVIDTDNNLGVKFIKPQVPESL